MSELGDVLGGRYRLERLLGRGGMSDVYEALDLTANVRVAIKLVRSGDPEFAKRLEREVQALESLEHPGLIRLLDTGQFADQAYLVMDYVDGPTLASSLRNGHLASPLVARMGGQLADTLAYVHAQGVVHRDVKPSNILLSSDGTAWLGDFGIALLHDATTITAVGATLGTVTYMAPEQFEGSDVAAPADVWSLGVVLLESLTGRRVFEGAPREVVARRLRGPVTLDDRLPVPWKMLLSAMLDERPASRPASRDVAALLATPAFATLWEPSAPAGARDELAHDETVVFDAATKVGPLGALGVLDADATTRRAATRSNVVARRAYERPRWLVPALIALALVVVLGVVLAEAFSGSPPTSTTTTSTTLASSSRALATLTQDIASSEAAQSLDAAIGQSVAVDAQQALVDASSANAAAVEADLQRAESTLVNAVTLAQVTPSAATTLERDVALLAAALGVAAPVATTTTTTTQAPGPPAPPGHGHGHGKH
ncbi:MAG TPA: serine/threonine-protein kinase [Acidimicrobiales bacterium]|nr:MAG: hypothetical protein B7X07_05430 [Actinobacteria bacterium 21-64-8]HQT99382.1 serine/threonine-protein kinase [Acidimicrobiales bacterium]